MGRHRRKEPELKDAPGNPQRIDEIAGDVSLERDVEPEERPLRAQHRDALGGVQPGEHLRHATRLGWPQDAPTAVMAGQRGDQAKAPAPRVVVRAHRGTSTDTSSDERPLAVTIPGPVAVGLPRVGARAGLRIRPCCSPDGPLPRFLVAALE